MVGDEANVRWEVLVEGEFSPSGVVCIMGGRVSCGKYFSPGSSEGCCNEDIDEK